MFKYLDQFNKWYDTVKEPWRILILVAFVAVTCICFTLSGILFFLGCVLGILIAVTAIRRVKHL